MMTEADAIALAEKRNLHMGKHLARTKMWVSAHDSTKGWHVTLVDRPTPTPVSNIEETEQDIQGSEQDSVQSSAKAA
jgi:hypothetical protein